MKEIDQYIVKSEHPKQTSIGHCPYCNQETYEGRTDKDGNWHYRCTNCAENYDPHYIFKDATPCPKCGCTNHIQICGGKLKENHPMIPDIRTLRCTNCETTFYNPEYEKVLFLRNIKSFIKK